MSRHVLRYVFYSRRSKKFGASRDQQQRSGRMTEAPQLGGE